MRTGHLLVGFVSGCALTVLTASALSPQTEAPDMEQMMAEAMEKYGVPSDEHQVLAGKVGKWDCAMKFWHVPGMPAEESVGQSTFKLIMGGRFLHEDFSMEYQGETFKGNGLTGFDRIKGKYFSAWIDNMSTSMSISEGFKSGDTFEFQGTMPDMMQGRYVDTRMVSKVVDENTIATDMFMPGPDGKEFKSMEITYTRASN